MCRGIKLGKVMNTTACQRLVLSSKSLEIALYQKGLPPVNFWYIGHSLVSGHCETEFCMQFNICFNLKFRALLQRIFAPFITFLRAKASELKRMLPASVTVSRNKIETNAACRPKLVRKVFSIENKSRLYQKYQKTKVGDSFYWLSSALSRKILIDLS